MNIEIKSDTKIPAEILKQMKVAAMKVWEEKRTKFFGNQINGYICFETNCGRVISLSSKPDLNEDYFLVVADKYQKTEISSCLTPSEFALLKQLVNGEAKVEGE